MQGMRARRLRQRPRTDGCGKLVTWLAWPLREGQAPALGGGMSGVFLARLTGGAGKGGVREQQVDTGAVCGVGGLGCSLRSRLRRSITQHLHTLAGVFCDVVDC